ncbi:MAG: DUF6867 family protein [Hyphomicrobiaceae bacterium]
MFDQVYPSGPNGFWVFVLLTVVLGGLTAWATGRAVASTWRPLVQIVGYIFLLALVVRFFHYALFQQPLLAPAAFVIDFTVLLAIAFCGYRWMRAWQMQEQYPWRYERRGLFFWRAHSGL